MTSVLVIGYAPDAVDFSDPALPPGLDQAKVADGIAKDLELMRARGWDAEHLPIRADDGLGGAICDRLARDRFDCVVIGAGVRMTTKHVAAFEKTVAAVRAGAPQTPIAFNASPDSSGEAVARVLALG